MKMPQKFKKQKQQKFDYDEIRTCIELQHSGYYDQCMCGHEFEENFDFELMDESIWDELDKEEEENYG